MYKNNVILLSKVPKKIESINPLISKIKYGGTLILSKCAVFASKKSRFF